jgi:hypothetical protein
MKSTGSIPVEEIRSFFRDFSTLQQANDMMWSLAEGSHQKMLHMLAMAEAMGYSRSIEKERVFS